MIRVALALGAALIALAAYTFNERQDHEAKAEGLRAVIQGHVSCNGALAGPDILVSAERCPPELAAVHATARRAEVCDKALLEGDLFTVRTACSTEVMTLLAQRDAESRRADSQADALRAERADRAAAITRAETRARSETERTHRAEAALQSAPRNGAGHVVLDARRLCELRDATAACDDARP